MLTQAEKRIVRAVAEAAIPAGRFFPAGGPEDAEKLGEYLDGGGTLARAFKAALHALDIGAALSPPFTRFHRLDLPRRERLLKRWHRGNALKAVIIEVLTAGIKTAHFSDDAVYSRLGCTWDKSPKNVEDPPYMRQVTRASEYSEGEVIECDAVVVGTGAGGGVVAKELAEKGAAVLIVEEGEYWTRKDFTGKSAECISRFYRGRGATFTVGNTVIPLPMGRLVGGSTAINTGTCWRTPEWVLESWVKDMGLTDLTPENMAPYFQRVEDFLRVEAAKEKVIGGIARVITRGCDALGYRHYPLRRNAPDCDAQGVCDFGCPTDAKLSTNISYIPAALKSGALLLEETRMTRVIIINGKAAGVEAVSTVNGRKIIARSKVVVLSCGAVMTPAALLAQGIGNSSGQVGKNLTIHPAVNVGGLFENDDISSFKFVPQGYCVDSFQKEGILLIHAGLPLDSGGVMIPFVGREFSETMSKFDRLAWFGAMVEDRPSGRVRVRNGRPRVSYWVRPRELAMLKRGIEILARIYLAAGAQCVYPLVRGWDRIAGMKDLEEFSRKKFSVRAYRIACFHPLGTCRMGTDPRTSVVDPSQRLHDIAGLYISDGSVVPSSLAVNPQETIMALSTRAADGIVKAIG